MVYFDRVEGDTFAVPKIHGIREAVVYAFSSKAFATLGRLYEQEIQAGNVGENLTLEELHEAEFVIGDEYEVGETRLRVSGPRYPCNRLNFCFQRDDAMKLFAEHRRPGVYFEVLREGKIQVGDQLNHVKAAGGAFSVLALFDHLTALKQVTAGKLTRTDVKPICEEVVRDKLVPEFLRARFLKMLGSS